MPRPKGFKLSDDTKRKISDSLTGRVIPQETRLKIGSANSGKTRSPELRNQISAALTGRKQTPEHIANRAKSRVGHHHSDDTKKRISDANMGHEVSTDTRDKLSKAHKLLGTKPPSRKGVKLLPHQVEAIRQRGIGRTLSPEHIELLRKVNTGSKHSEEAKQKMRDAPRPKGAAHWNWNPDREQIRIGKQIRKKARTALDNTLRLLERKKGNQTTTHLLGYSFNQLIEHLQSFTNWNELKLKKWHLDHIFPIKAFVDYNISNIKVINCLSNLRPLDAKENLSKSDKYDKIKFEDWLKSKGLF